MPNDFSVDQEATIESVRTIVDSTYGKKAMFRVKGYPHEVSTFTKWPENIIPGAKIFGHIEVKDGKYHNWKFGKKNGLSPNSPALASESRASNQIEFKVLPALEAIYGRLGLIGAALNIKMDPYPKMDATNDAHGLDEVDMSQSPF